MKYKNLTEIKGKKLEEKLMEKRTFVKGEDIEGGGKGERERGERRRWKF